MPVSEREKNAFSVFFSREAWFCFRQRHGCAFARGTDVPLSEREKNRAPGLVFSPGFFIRFFHEKKVRQNLSTWDLILKISTRGIQ